MKALLVNCTLKPSPEKSNTEALAEVVAEACARRALRWHRSPRSPVLLATSASRSPARRGPTGTWGRGPGEDYSETEEGHEWSHSTGRTAAANLLAVCRSSYIDPRLLDRFRDGKTIELPSLSADEAVTSRKQGLIERRALGLIE